MGKNAKKDFFFGSLELNIQLPPIRIVFFYSFIEGKKSKQKIVTHKYRIYIYIRLEYAYPLNELRQVNKNSM